MLSPYLKRILIDIALGAAILLGLFYFRQVFLDFLISLFHFKGKINLSSISYLIMRCTYVFIPLIMLSIPKNSTKKRKHKMLKTMYMIIGICYLVGNTWIIYYIAYGNPISDLFLAALPKFLLSENMIAKVEEAYVRLFACQYNNALVMNYLVWDSYEIYGVIFSIIQGCLYIKLSRGLSGHRKDVLENIITITIISTVLPFIHALITNGNLRVSSEWHIRNVMLIVESVFVIIALKLSSTTKMLWADLLW